MAAKKEAVGLGIETDQDTKEWLGFDHEIVKKLEDEKNVADNASAEKETGQAFTSVIQSIAPIRQEGQIEITLKDKSYNSIFANGKNIDFINGKGFGSKADLLALIKGGYAYGVPD